MRGSYVDSVLFPTKTRRARPACECGRPITAFFRNQPSYRAYRHDSSHTLCFRCWHAERDRTRTLKGMAA